MAWTKRDVIKKAYAEIGKASYDFDLQPEEMQDALQSLDAMVSAWGLNFGYSGGDGKGDIDADTEVPQFAYEALYTNLALRLAPGMGKTVSPETKTFARQGLNTLQTNSLPFGRARSAVMPEADRATTTCRKPLTLWRLAGMATFNWVIADDQRIDRRNRTAN